MLTKGVVDYVNYHFIFFFFLLHDVVNETKNNNNNNKNEKMSKLSIWSGVVLLLQAYGIIYVD